MPRITLLVFLSVFGFTARFLVNPICVKGKALIKSFIEIDESAFQITLTAVLLYSSSFIYTLFYAI